MDLDFSLLGKLLRSTGANFLPDLGVTAAKNLGIAPTPERQQTWDEAQSVMPQMREPAQRQIVQDLAMGFGTDAGGGGLAGLTRGKRSANADQAALAEALRLKSEGKNTNQQWMGTGNKAFVDPLDDIPKQVINMNQSVWHPDIAKKATHADFMGANMGDLLPHSPVWEAYPHLKDFKFMGSIDPNNTGGGHFDAANKEIVLDPRNSTELQSNVIHELGHGIQAHERWPGDGANSKHVEKLLGADQAPVSFEKQLKAFETYLRNSGEVQSRGAESQFLRSLEPGGEHAYQNPTSFYYDRKPSDTWNYYNAMNSPGPAAMKRLAIQLRQIQMRNPDQYGAEWNRLFDLSDPFGKHVP